MGTLGVLLMLTGAWREALYGAALYAAMMALLMLCPVMPDALAAFVSMLVMCLRKIAPTLYFASGLIATTRVSELVCALQRMHVPKSVVITFAVTLRFFPTAKEEFAAIRDAMRLRGIGLSARNIFTRPLAVLECVFVPMIMRCAALADELAAAAVCRGIDGEGRRSSLIELRLRSGDVIVIAVFAALAVFALFGGVGALGSVDVFGGMRTLAGAGIAGVLSPLDTFAAFAAGWGLYA
jgi:energy-coupling factor transport system permease protein